MAHVTKEQFQTIKDIIADAKNSSRLSSWEREFVSSLSTNVERYGDALLLTDKQEAILSRIESKIYAVG